MGALAPELLPLAVAVAVSPLPLSAALLMLLTGRAGVTGVGRAA